MEVKGTGKDAAIIWEHEGCVNTKGKARLQTKAQEGVTQGNEINVCAFKPWNTAS